MRTGWYYVCATAWHVAVAGIDLLTRLALAQGEC